MSEPGAQTLPLFPLELVLVPGEFLPLHIFEERYKRMVGRARDTDGPFGIVLRMGNGVAAVGCSARVSEVLEEFPDGRLNIVVRGETPFRLLELVFPDDPDLEPLSASVEFLQEDPAQVPAELLKEAQQLTARVKELADEPDEEEELVDAAFEDELAAGTEAPPPEEAPPDLTPMPGDSFGLAAGVDLELTFKQRLLQLTNETERLRLLSGYLDTLAARMEVLRERRDAIRGNGKGY
jgi:ATP-dependent Lon protease